MVQPPRRTRIVFAGLAVVLALVAAWRLSGLVAFVWDVERVERAVESDTKFGRTHNCLTCYVVGAHLAAEGDANLYASRHYEEEPRDRTPIHAEIGGRFTIDDFPYPPPLLVVHRALLWLGLDFFAIRRVWFVLVALCIGASLVVAGAWAGALRGEPALLLLVFAFVATGPLLTLQIGNVHPAVVAVTLLGLIASDGRRPWLAGALLAAGAVVKIWPAIFLIVFALQRRWREIGATAAFALCYLLVSLAVLGLQPHVAFVEHQLPRLADGSAFHFMTRPGPMSENLAIAGIPHRLHALGVLAAEPPLLAPWLAHGYTAVLLAATAMAGWRLRRAVGDDDATRIWRIGLWLAIAFLAQLRSPFLPWPYGMLTPLLLFVFLLPGRARWPALAIGGVLVFLSLPLAEDRPRFFQAAAVMVLGLIACAVALSARRPQGPLARPT